MRRWILLLWLRSLQVRDRVRLAVLHWRHPGLSIDPNASSNFGHAEFHLGPGARLEIRAGAVTERRPGALRFMLGDRAHVVVGEGTWVRGDLGTVVIAAFEDARIDIGPESFLNGCHLSAKVELTLGRRAWVGPGTRVFDSDQHDFDDTRPERKEPLSIGEYAWVASDCTVLRGAHIGAHSIIGARSVVTKPVPDHTLALGAPATARGEVGDRTGTR